MDPNCQKHQEFEDVPPDISFPKRPIRVLSLFDGIGTGLYVLEKLGIEVEVYYASEIDEAAQNVSETNFGSRITWIGDVTTFTDKQITELCPIDLLIGGSPCNDLSHVNPNRKGLFDPSGTGILFFHFFRAQKVIEAKNSGTHLFWMYENVLNMPREFKKHISLFLQREPAVIDAKHFSAQSRPRCFWGNIPGMYDPIPSHLLKKKFHLNEYLNKIGNREALVDKINCITTNPASLKLGSNVEWPIRMNDHGDTPWLTEIEKIFGFPSHYTDVGNTSLKERQTLLGRAWSVPVIEHILQPLTNSEAFQQRTCIGNSEQWLLVYTVEYKKTVCLISWHCSQRGEFVERRTQQDPGIMQNPKPSGAFGKGERRERSAWRHLLLLLWKSLLLRRRHWLLTLLEVILPVGLFSVMLFIRLIPGSNFSTYHFNETIARPEEEFYLREQVCWKYGTWFGNACRAYPTSPATVYYGPDTPFTQDIAKYIAQELGFLEQNIRATASNDEIDKLVEMSYYAKNSSHSPSNYNVGLFFHLDDRESSDPPQKLAYDLRLPGRWSTMWIYDFLQLPGPGYSNEVYKDQGFTLIQSLLDRRYISIISNDTSYTDNYKIEIQKYPYPAYDSDLGISFVYSTVLPSSLVMALVLLAPSLIKTSSHLSFPPASRPLIPSQFSPSIPAHASLSFSRSTLNPMLFSPHKELVCLMGMNRWLVWLGWFLHSALLNVVVISALTVMLSVSMYNGDLYVPPILAHTDTGYVWLLLFLYSFSSIAFCLAISTFFNRPTLAMTVGILVWLLSYSIPNNLMYYKYDTLGQAPKVLSCLLPNMAITWAFKIIQMFEGRGKGVVWSTIWEPGNPRDQLNPAIILIMLAFDTFLYLLITWYVDQVNPGTYGVPQPWYFPFQKSYWCGSRLTSHSGSPEDFGENQEYFEKEPAGLKPGIVIKNLRKEFKELGRKTKVAVENVSLTCYEGQCTVLLGHNGAGKTTTMSVLTGVYAATSGYAEVNGWNIATNLSEAREELGLCPQHNMLFVDLTVLQHLLFFGRLKGLTSKAAKAEALEILTRLELLDKQQMFGNQLSGGMKRKLSLAISLMGSTKVVILDEPSSGLDPESRRWVWDVVQGERGRRTFLITTHHMEEADVLGDRVAIMASGRVVCTGSTLFLKRKPSVIQWVWLSGN
ncbi:putative ATP-binding cassette sub-family A member 3-like [Penaeus vannamei]|uniref:Putative ATP-binding cassette sub-family A member 3-like n=1 Tax=Penaeus vannamei TaxID=6689 RepID=A0A3R7P9L1_PENVA|nr:putative ATP-binding cassette sub-family A member 3-like [Penaeus vannamei]